MISLFSAVASLATEWLNGRQKISAAKAEAKAEVEAQKISIEGRRVQDMGTSWKDEFWCVIFALPLVLVFIPPIQVYIIEGFEVLKTLPDWYIGLLVSMVAASFGLTKTDAIKGILKR